MQGNEIVRRFKIEELDNNTNVEVDTGILWSWVTHLRWPDKPGHVRIPQLLVSVKIESTCQRTCIW